MKGSFMALIIAVFVMTSPLYADPGGSPSVGAQSFAMMSDQAPVLGATNPAAAESFKSIIYPIAGGVVALLGAILAALIVAPLMPLSMNTSRGRQFETNAFGLRLKRTKSPVLKSA